MSDHRANGDTPRHQFDFRGLEPASVPVHFGDKTYVLREASAGAASQWHNFHLGKTKIVDGKIERSLEGSAEAATFLLSLCLFEQYKDRKTEEDRERRVEQQVLRGWPEQVVQALFEEAKRISGLSPKRTRAELTEQIADLREELAALDSEGGRAAGGEDRDPNSRMSSTADTSA